jgi:hypothetical protein
MGSVADGLRPAEENDVLELDGRKDLRLKTAEQTVAVGGSLSKDTAGRSVYHWRPLGQNLREALGPDSTKPRLRDYRQTKSFSDFWKSSEATASPSFCGRLQSPAGRKVQWRVGPRRTVLRATAAEAGAVCPANASGLSVRTNAPPDDETVRGVVQRSHHLISTRYQFAFLSV